MSTALLQQLVPPTEVTACITAHLTSSTEANLVLARSSLLQIYALTKADPQSESSSCSLSLVLEYRLNGTVEDMVALKGSGQTDYLMLTFPDAKATLLEYRPATGDLQTVSLHCFEHPKLQLGRTKFARGPWLRCDPDSRTCAAMLVFDKHLGFVSRVTDLLTMDDFLPSSAASSENLSKILQPSFVVSLASLEIHDLTDFAFMHGYFEPTLLILHRLPGQVVNPKDPFVLAAVSVDSTQKKCTMIWSFDKLPTGCSDLVPVPSPIGGALVLAPNFVAYCNQKIKYFLSLNKFGEKILGEAAAQFDVASGSTVLQTPKALVLAPDRILLSVKSGEIFLLSIVHEGPNFIRLQIAPSTTSLIRASCLCTLPDTDLFFLGSKHGDSLLVRHSEHPTEDKMDDGTQRNPLKGSRTRLSTSLASEDIYGSTSGASSSSSSHASESQFTVVDSLISTSPIRDVTWGESFDPASQSLAAIAGGEAKYELVACCGEGNTGSLAIFQKYVRPVLLSSVGIPECQGVWALQHKESSTAAASSDKHAFMLVSTKDATKIFSCKGELKEVSTDFISSVQTIAAGTVLGGTRILQVYSKGIALLDGAYKAGEWVPPDEIVFASILDPHIAVLLKNGSVMLVTLDVGDKFTSTRISEAKPSGSSVVCTTAVTLFQHTFPAGLKKSSQTSTAIDDDYAMLYGTAEPVQDSAEAVPAIYCALALNNGALEIFDLETKQRVWMSGAFSFGSLLLQDAQEAPQPLENVEFPVPQVSELSFTKLSKAKNGCLLAMAMLTSGDLLLYRVVTTTSGNFPAVLCKINHSAYTREYVKPSDIPEEEKVPTLVPPLPRRLRRISPLISDNSYSFVAIGGSCPHLILDSKGYPRILPFSCEGDVSSFTAFNSAICANGFAYTSASGKLSFGQIPSYMNYDSFWPVKKIPLRATPSKLAYHREAKLYALAMNSPTTIPLADLIPPPATVQARPEPPVGEPPMPIDIGYQTELRVITPGTWETIAAIPMGANELITDVKAIPLHNGLSGAESMFVVASLTTAISEDLACKGRVVLLPLTHGKVPVAEDLISLTPKEPRGAITSVCGIEGNLCIAVGMTLLVYTMRTQNSTLEPIGKLDLAIQIVAMSSLRGFVIAGDSYMGGFFLRWKEEHGGPGGSGKQLLRLAKDWERTNTTACEFVLEGNNLGLLVADETGNVQILQYSPTSADSRNGTKLLPRADINCASLITKFVRVNALDPNTNPPKPSTRLAVCLFGSNTGALGCVRPLEETEFRTLITLQARLNAHLEHFAGLNPVEFRRLQGITTPRNAKHNILDMDILQEFFHLPAADQAYISKKLGTTSSSLKSFLHNVLLSTNFFS